MATVEVQKRLVGAYNRTKTQAEQQIEKEATEAASAKVATSTDPRLMASASLVKSVQSGDAVQASADVLKLSGESLAKVAPSANGLVATASAITSVNKAAQGDTFTAASAAALAIEKASPKLANSAVGAVANAFVLGTADTKIAQQKQAVSQSAKRVMDATATPKQRLAAGFDLTNAVQGLANFYRAAGNALWKVATFALGKAGQAYWEAFQPAGVCDVTAVLERAAEQDGPWTHRVEMRFGGAASMRYEDFPYPLEAIHGRVPCLQAGRKILFNLQAVRETLLRRAAQPSEPERRADHA